MTQPAFTETLAVLRVFAGSPEDHDLLAAVEFTNATHQPVGDTERFDGSWGRCIACRRLWPCQPWVATETACVDWLIRATAARLHLTTAAGGLS